MHLLVRQVLLTPNPCRPAAACRWVFQGVHMLLQFSCSSEGAGRPWQPEEKRVNKIVFIGKNLKRAELLESLNSCLAK